MSCSREDVADYLCDLLEKKEIPLRVTHNDTKLNNIMIDDKLPEKASASSTWIP